MKNLLLILAGVAACFACGWALVSFISASFEVPEEGVTFHKVPLVCGAAPDIGCGSRSKPILLDLQKDPTIREAYLNRAGTVVAVVWEENAEPNIKAVPTIFKRHGKSFKSLKGNAYQKQFASFNTDRWYKGEEVNELSMEEAGRIATQITDWLISYDALPEENVSKLHEEIEAYIQNEFLTLEDVSLLNTTEYYDQWEKDISKISEPFVIGGKVPDLEMCGPFSSTSCKADGSNDCCAKHKAEAELSKANP